MAAEPETLHEGHRRRLRQRYLTQGLEGFMPHEALELLLFYAIPRRDTNLLAHRLLRRFGTLGGVLCASPEELMRVEGVGEQAAALISLVKGIGALAARGGGGALPSVKTNEKLRDYCLSLPFSPGKETFYLLCVDAQWRVLRAAPLFSGTIDRVSVHSRVVVETALQNRAFYALAVHNHPSELAEPSQADVEITEKIRIALEAAEIPLVDHLIVANGRVLSLRRWEALGSAARQIGQDFQMAADRAGRAAGGAPLLKDALAAPGGPEDSYFI